MGGSGAAAGVAAGKPAKRVSAAERRLQYLTVAAGLVIAHGADAVTMEAVAAGANVNKALLYRQFSNRSELLLELFEQETSELDERVAIAIENAGTFEDKVRAWVHTWFAYMGHRGTLYYRLVDAARTIASAAAERPHRERQKRIVKFHSEWYADEFGISRDQAADLAAMLYAALSGAIDRWVASPGAATRRRLEDTYVHLVLGALERMREAVQPVQPARANGSSRRA